MGDLQNFAEGVRLLIGILFAVSLAALKLLVTWTILNCIKFRRDQHEALRRFDAEHFDEAHRPLPPVAPGVCDRCGKVFPEVRYLPGNRRRCENCFQHERNADASNHQAA